MSHNLYHNLDQTHEPITNGNNNETTSVSSSFDERNEVTIPLSSSTMNKNTNNESHSQTNVNASAVHQVYYYPNPEYPVVVDPRASNALPYETNNERETIGSMTSSNQQQFVSDKNSSIQLQLYPLSPQHNDPASPWIMPYLVHPGTAASLSFLFAGAGQILLGQQRKGLAICALGVIFGIILVFLHFLAIGLFLIPLFIIWVLAVSYDAQRIANRIQMGYPVQHGECSNRLVKLGLKYFLKDVPIFDHNKEEECPLEWKQAMQQFKQQYKNDVNVNVQV